MIWIVFAAMTAAVLAALLWPVVKSKPAETQAERAAYDRAVFRDQLAELERDVARGTIGQAEADAARNEISRRLIATAEAPQRRKAPGFAWAAIAATLIVPAVALPLYLRAGNPQLADVPHAWRMANAEKNGDMEALVEKVELHLEANPDDLQGWQILAPVYRRDQRWDDAAEAYRNIVRLSPPDAASISDYGEALVMGNQGMVPAQAQALFEKALKLDPTFPKARFYEALALKQQGKADEAKAAFEAFLKDTPADAPWRPMLLAEMRDMTAKPPALDQQTMADAQNMPAGDQQAMIRGMVDGLEQKLAANPDNLDGWLRLIRARAVLGDTDKAKAAYDKAKDQFAANQDALSQIDGLAKEMNVQ
ncbi:MAG: c-type cytochrome biogenesis protein CcmI [Aestuariivirga sp.]|uniref:c-type cytochrome biogenesis protein CcmI n=1 Tax=Aestuariivirga sp. TaxID=2650926 RepID=UPI0025BFEF10|nr:c-type cytochrome biogenesis protein CcmI [Aestuariivirga sp.]MCA3561473.1 c-type cytochrome biogenesis protein CcmI [Aestuariivirga sp.]